MAQFAFDNFGDLYRAAFAEQDPEQKLLLLSEVRRAIKRWEDEASLSPIPEKAKPSAILQKFKQPAAFENKLIA